MTDADVDGSHIRTLLMTFFFRQMPELIEKGHLFVAQPPLYKVSRGKSSRYILDEHEFEQFLLQRITDEFELKVDKRKDSLKGQELKNFYKKVSARRSIIQALEKKNAPYFLVRLLLENGLTDENSLRDKTKMEKMKDLFKQKDLKADVKWDEEHGIFELTVSFRVNGMTLISNIDKDLINSPRFQHLVQIHQELKDLKPPFRVVNNGESIELENEARVLEYLQEQAKKGIAIQRYKGLGEMTPHQLWETTMDPENRSLMKVSIQDAVAADQVFNILMGGEVESRRNFIEQNALEAQNLDI
jgi:DNA gyrase subunit B